MTDSINLSIAKIIGLGNFSFNYLSLRCTSFVAFGEDSFCPLRIVSLLSPYSLQLYIDYASLLFYIPPSRPVGRRYEKRPEKSKVINPMKQHVCLSMRTSIDTFSVPLMKSLFHSIWPWRQLWNNNYLARNE